MKTISARISTKYQVVIPKFVRELLQLQPQDTLLFLVYNSTVILRPKPKSFTAAMRGLHQELWPDPDTWLEKERSTWE